MNIIKLNAIDSTNSYLKKMVSLKPLENFTVVVAENQFEGRGQMGTVWESEVSKNLTFSILIKFSNFDITKQFYLSMAVALGVLNALKPYVNNMLYIKWPNDILADKDKICGILIENVLSSSKIKHAIVGIGLNVNQELFSESILNVTSLKKLTGKEFDKNKVLLNVVNAIEDYIKFIENEDFKALKKMYITALYKFETPVMFENKEGVFLGKIVDISEEGQLVVELKNETIRKYSLKEIKFANR